MVRSLLIIFTVLTCPLHALSQETDAYVRGAMTQWGAQALSVGVYQNGLITNNSNCGAVRPDSFYCIGDVERGMRAALVGSWIDGSDLNFDAPVVAILPNLRLSDPYVTRSVTLVDLLSGRVGFTTEEALVTELLWRQPLSERLRRLENLPLNGGFRFRNQEESSSTAIADAWLEEVSDMDYETVLRQGLLIPLRCSDPSAFPQMRVADLLLWGECLLQQGGKVLQPSTVEALLQPRIWMSPEKALTPQPGLCAYGLGWRMQDYRGRRLFWQRGDYAGDQTLFLIVPQENLALVVCAHAPAGKLTEAIALRLIDYHLGYTGRDWSTEFRRQHRNVVVSRAAQARSAPNLTAFEGTYSNSLLGDWQVRTEEGQLKIYDAQGLTALLVPCYGNSFRFRLDGDAVMDENKFVTFLRSESGRLDELRLEPSTRWKRSP